MSGVDKEYEDLLLKSWENPTEQVNHVIYKERKVVAAMKKKIHTQDLCDYYKERCWRCPYCADGWVIGTKEEILRGIDKR